jgi:DNA polymerase I
MRGRIVTEKIRFQILDASYEVIEGEPRIVLWSRLDNDERAVILYKGFRPYFYALLDEGANVEQVIKEIRKLSRPKSPIISVEPVEKKYFGRPVKVLKITTVIPEFVREYREEVAKIRGIKDVLEADIRFALRFLIDKNLYPMRWYEAKGSELKVRWYRTDAVYELEEEPVEAKGGERADPLEGLKIMAFDIEVYNPQRSPDPSRDPVILIGAQFDDEDPIILEADGKSDAKLIESFVNLVLEKDPDIIVGYNSNRFDWPYLLERSKINGIKLDVTRRIGATPQPSVYGHISVPGRLNVDLIDFAEELHEIKMKTLEEVADYLGVMPKDKRVNLEWWQIAEYWDDVSKRPILKKYTEHDVISTMGLAKKFLPFGAQLSQVSGLPLDQVMAASVGFRLEWRLIREAYKQNELVPNRVERREERYAGAIVLQPLKGVHENIAVLDFASMYPNIMVKYNVGPDTLIRRGESYDPNNVYVAPEVGHKFRKSPEGFFKKVLSRFLAWRKQIKEEMKKYDPDSPEYKLLDERQKAIKVLANASYGYMGWSMARWYCKECAEAVTAWGRNLIKTSIAMARDLGLKVIYGDTDSLFVKYDKEKVEKLIEKIEKELGFEVKIDKIYRRVFFTEAKKRYVGLTMDGKIDVVGFEAVRGDWSDLAKETQLKVMEIVLSTGNVDEAINYVRKVISDLRQRRIPIEKLVIWKTLTKRAEEYETEAPHVAAAKIMEKLGYRTYPGMKIGYVVTKGSGKISERSKPYFIVKPEEIDVNYYIDKQVIPAVLRILSYFGVTEKRLKSGAGGKQKSLLDFFS